MESINNELLNVTYELDNELRNELWKQLNDIKE